MKRYLLPLLLILALLLSACAKTPADPVKTDEPEPTPTVEPTPEPEPEPEPTPDPEPEEPYVPDPNEYTIDKEEGMNQITVYWVKPGQDYSTCDMWIWYLGADGHGYSFHECAYGAKVVLNLPDTVKNMGYIVRYDCSDPGGSTWGDAKKDIQDDQS